MDRTLHPVIETRATQRHPDTIDRASREIQRSAGATQVERRDSGILRELAEQLRHWD